MLEDGVALVMALRIGIVLVLLGRPLPFRDFVGRPALCVALK